MVEGAMEMICDDDFGTASVALFKNKNCRPAPSLLNWFTSRSHGSEIVTVRPPFTADAHTTLTG